MIGEGQRQSMLEHLEELRARLFKASLALVAGAIVAYLFRDRLFSLLTEPFYQAFPDAELVTLKPTEAFSASMRIALFGGFVLGSLPITWQLWRFGAPGLTAKERKWAVPIVAALVILFLVGVGFAYTILPRGLEFLQGMLDVAVGTTVNEYLSFVLRFLLVFGLSFEFPVFLFAAAAMGLVTSRQLGQGRRWAVLAITVLAAMATPTGDAFTMFFLAVPLYVLYEIDILLIKLVLRK